MQAYDRAISLDPNYARAHARRAATLDAIIFFEGDKNVRARERMEALESAKRAVSLAPNLGEAHAVLGEIHEESLNAADAALELDRAVMLAPGSATVQRAVAYFAAELGHFDIAERAAQQSISLDPQNVISYVVFASVLVGDKRFEDGLAALRAASALEPASAYAAGTQANLLLASGQVRRAVELCESPGTPIQKWGRSACLALAYHASGRQAEAEREFKTFNALLADAAPVQRAGIYAQWGERSQALKWLRKAEDLRDTDLIGIRTAWELDPIRDDAEYRAIEARLKLPK